MELSLYETCAKAVSQSLLSALSRDPLRGISTPNEKRAFLKTVQTKMRQSGYLTKVEVNLRGLSPTVTIKVSSPDPDLANYSATFDLHTLTEMLNLSNTKLRLSR